MESSVRLIPSFISARSPKGLRVEMFKNNLKYGKKFHYFDIQFVKGRWYAWYEIKFKREDLV